MDNAYSADVEPLYDNGVPVFLNLIEDTPDHQKYFKYHHTAGDSMSIMDADDMDSNVVGMAVFLYILADLENSVRNMDHLNRIKYSNLVTDTEEIKMDVGWI